MSIDSLDAFDIKDWAQKHTSETVSDADQPLLVIQSQLAEFYSVPILESASQQGEIRVTFSTPVKNVNVQILRDRFGLTSSTSGNEQGDTATD